MDGAHVNGPSGAIGFVGLPRILRSDESARRWVGWRWELRGGKWDKPPRTVIGGRANGYAKSDDPSTWATFAEAKAALDAGGMSGVGLQLLDLPRLAAIDLDDVRNPDTGEILPWARDLIERSGSYAEITPCGTGARILGRVDLDHEAEHKSFDHPEGGKVELFVNMTSGRYITVTGAQIEGTPEKLRDVSVIVAEILALKADQERVAGEKAAREKAKKASGIFLELRHRRHRRRQLRRGRRGRGARGARPSSTPTWTTRIGCGADGLARRARRRRPGAGRRMVEQGLEVR